MSESRHHGRCKHFNGIQNKACAQGVRYEQFWPGMPCIQWIEESARGDTYLGPGEEPVARKPVPKAQPTDRCRFYAEPTDEEVQRYRQELEASMDGAEKAMEFAANWRVTPKPDHDRHEVVICPCCNCRLNLSQSAYNGHVHGRCETDGCVSWME